MIARPKISRNEWKPAELGAFEVGNFALLSCPGDDLQAWYHATFSGELYRLRGAFWWKEAILPDYASHPIGAASDDKAEKLLCSPNTIYTAMAATMYTIRSTLAEREYDLFEKLTTAGVTVLKHPFRSGRPTKKRFQLSLVQGDMYLFMYAGTFATSA